MAAPAFLTFVLVGATATALAGGSQRFGETCTGSETVQAAGQPPVRAAYAIALSVDLANKLYCYEACGKDQTYEVAEADASPIRLADVDTGQQVRRLSYDRRTSRLSDDQRITLGPISIVRHARATCRPAPFRPPFQP